MTHLHPIFKPLLAVIFLLTFSLTAHAGKAPDFSLDGATQKVQLSKFRNKVVYVDFWASWCKPCRKSFSFMNDMQTRYSKKGLEVIAINLDTDRKAAENFLRKHPAHFTVAFDPEGKTPASYHLKVMPTSYLIDRRGNIIKVHKGFKENQKLELEKTISSALARS